MIDLFYKFDRRDSMLDNISALGMTYDENNLTLVLDGSHQYSAWEVGEIAGNDGWHLNVRVVDPEFDLSSLEPYRVYPNQPVCVWA